MDEKKFNLTQTGQQVQDILNSAKSTDQVLTEIHEAMEGLPDGQAVSAQVALNTVAIQELDDNKASKTEVENDYAKKTECVFDISAYHATGTPPVLATYDDLAAALGTNGANVPEALRKGGMSVKFVHTFDNKYVQFRYMSSSTAVADFTNVANWQGVDEKPTAGSHNLVESGRVYDEFVDINKQIGNYMPFRYIYQNKSYEGTGLNSNTGKTAISIITEPDDYIIEVADSSLVHRVYTYSDDKYVTADYNTPDSGMVRLYPTVIDATHIEVSLPNGKTNLCITYNGVISEAYYTYYNSIIRSISNVENTVEDLEDICISPKILDTFAQNKSYEPVGLYSNNGKTAVGLICTAGKYVVRVNDTSDLRRIYCYSANKYITAEYSADANRIQLDYTIVDANNILLSLPEGKTNIALTFNALISKCMICGVNDSIYAKVINNEVNINDIYQNLQRLDEVEEIVKTLQPEDSIINQNKSYEGVGLYTNNGKTAIGLITVAGKYLVKMPDTTLLHRIYTYSDNKYVTGEYTSDHNMTRLYPVILDANYALVELPSGKTNICITYNGITSSVEIYSLTTNEGKTLYDYLRCNQFDNYLKIDGSKNVICFGDSRTGNHWQDYLETKLNVQGLNIVDAGVGGERTLDIGVRSGAVDFMTKAFTIPATAISVDFDAVGLWCGVENGLRILHLGASNAWNNDAQINPVTIQGIKGNINRKTLPDDIEVPNEHFTFTRLEAGEVLEVNTYTPIQTKASAFLKNGVAILFSGANDGIHNEDDIDNFIALQKSIVEKYKRFIIIADTYNASEVGQTQTLLPLQLKKQCYAFGNNVVDIYNYALRYASTDYNLPISTSDAERIARGEMPYTLTNDGVHQTTVMQQITAEMVYQKGVELGYWD